MIRLIELFAGIGSQAKALKRAKIPYEHWRMCELDKYAVKSYNAIHGTNFPITDICSINGDWLGVDNTAEYLLTYSFPCQDLSLAGKQQGMDKGTRSGLLWEVERLLKESTYLPQTLLMENVPQVHGKKNLHNFEKWLFQLEKFGYKNTYYDLNSCDYGVPQSRNRTYMVSTLNNRNFKRPLQKPLTKLLKDVLEDKVDEKFYLNNIQIKNRFASNFNQHARLEDTEGCCSTLMARDYKDAKIVVVGDLIRPGFHESSLRVYDPNGIAPTCNTNCGGGHETKILEPVILDDTYGFEDKPRIYTYCPTIRAERQGLKVLNGNTRIRKLTPRETWRLMGFDDEDFDKAKATGMSNSQLYKQAGNSIVVNVLEEIFKEML